MFGRCKHTAAAVLSLCFSSVMVFAQSTRVKGRVTDADTGEGIPFVGIYFKNTTVGVSTDMDGCYSLEARESPGTLLCATLLGYDSVEKEVHPGSYQVVNFQLKPTDNRLNAVLVKPDNSRMVRIMRLIDENRSRNNPEKREVYQCTIYSKIELDVTNADERIRGRLIRKNFGFVFDYMDTSVVSGKPYLPVMISETVSRRYHKNTPALDKEVIEASRISGLDDENLVSQFTGSLHLKMNFYNNFINAFDVEIPSPISPSGMLYYNYYLIDSLTIEGRKTYHIRYHPKKSVSSPVFDGEMYIDTEDWALREMHAKLYRTSNVNWIRDLVLDVENQRLGDSTWFYKQDRMYVDFSPAFTDSSKMISFLGRRQMDYTEPDFSMPLHKDMAESGYNVMVIKGAGGKDEEYWQEARPYELSENERNIYHMVDSVKQVPLYRDLYAIVSTFVNGYYDIGKVSMGPVYKFFSFNNLEGARFQFGLRTSAEFSKKIRFMLYGAYGTKDKAVKGGGSVEYMFRKLPTSKLSFSAKRDMLQLGKGSDSFTESNIFSSLFSKQGSQKMSPVTQISAVYEQEITAGINAMAGLEFRTIFSNQFVPMDRPDGESINSVTSNQAHIQFRFSWDETVNRGHFVKTYLYTKYPVVTLDFIGALAGLARNDYTYFRPELTVEYRLPLPPAGVSRFRLNTGTIIGEVPYPLMKLHEGNGSYFLDQSSFACMDYYEFASDTWLTLFYEHNFNGFFLGRIPLIKKLRLREVFTLKAAYGTISDKNNGSRDLDSGAQAVILFPEGMSSLDKPYMEMGVGISNIMKMFRVDAFWRVTHRYRTENGVRQKVDNRFALNFGIEMTF